MRVSADVRSTLGFSTTWEILGPFQIGTREATWGADPLERLGGFKALTYDVDRKFASSLAPGGLVSWQTVRARNCNARPQPEAASTIACVSTDLCIDFGEIDWSSHASMYGWPSLQWQAWARGILNNGTSSEASVLLHVDRVLEFWVDDRHFFGGDYYAFRRAPCVVRLAPGQHVLNVRLLRDVRLDGAHLPPDLNIHLEASIRSADLLIHKDKKIIPETVVGKLSGAFMSVPVTNIGDKSIYVRSVQYVRRDVDDHRWPISTNLSEASIDESFSLTIYQPLPLVLAPGQTRPIVLRINFQEIGLRSFHFNFMYNCSYESQCRSSQTVECLLKDRDLHEPHRLTYLHPNGAVSFALLKPPSRGACQLHEGSCKALPIVLLLHGAGVDVDGPQTRKVMDTWPDLPAWTLAPSGITTWASDDWHGLGMQDIEASVEHLCWWKRNTDWDGPASQGNKWLVVGHSNGGQGVWHLLTHRPDKIIGAAAVSGYSSIQAYVPYSFWHETDADIAAWIARGLQDSRHETLLSNAKGIPIYIQHGSEDDNVPVSHSRRMFQLLSQMSLSDLHYCELPGKGHWFDGVLTTQALLSFYAEILRKSQHPPLPKRFEVSISTPASMGTIAGIKVISLLEIRRMGFLYVVRSSTEWQLKTNNILRFRFLDSPYFDDLARIISVDGQRFELRETSQLLCHELYLDENRKWKLVPTPYPSDSDAKNHGGPKQNLQQGSLDTILRSPSSFSINVGLSRCFDAALQVSRNLHQYFSADTELMGDILCPTHPSGNAITVLMGMEHSRKKHTAIKISESGITIELAGGRSANFPLEKGIGAIYLSPTTANRLELIVWGVDEEGLRLANRLFPLLTGVGQPGFVVVGKSCAWRGLSGALAMGSFTESWKACDSSFIRTISQ